MKDDISRILGHLVANEEIARMRNWLLMLDTANLSEMATAINQLSDSIQRTNLHSHESVGLYRLFLACLYYELNEYQSAIPRLQIAMQEIWGNPVNKSLVCWLLGLCYSNAGDYPEARRFLQDALQILAVQTRHSSLHADRERRTRQSIEQDIQNALDRFFNEPLFRTVRPDPSQTTSGFPLQEPHNSDDEKGISISLNFPISVNNENNPVNNVSSSSNPALKDERFASKEHLNIPDSYESRTDQTGFMVLPTQPIYKQELRAGKSGIPELEVAPNHFAEITEVRLNDAFYSLHSIRSGKRINPESSASWGWMRVKGNSMNAMKGRVSIEDGDFVLIKFDDDGDEGDIVVAYREIQNREEKFAVVKRYKRSKGLLVSESNLKGPEYDPIDIKKDKVLIRGVVYAVAKPVTK